MKRILVVDDDRNTREALAFLLVSGGYEVHEASDGEEALEYLERLPFDLVLLDQAMPRRTGLEVMESLHNIAHSAPVILITAQDSANVRQQAAALNAAAFVVKPIKRQRLMELIEKALACKVSGPDSRLTKGEPIKPKDKVG